VQDQALERLSAGGNDEQAARRPAGDEGLLDGSAAGDELLALGEEVGRRRGRR
jgi:hypothetical protein